MKSLHKSRGVKFATKKDVIRVDKAVDNPNKITQVNLRGKRIETDYLVIFNDERINLTNFINNPLYTEDIVFSKEKQMYTEVSQGTGSKRIFGAGDISAPVHFFTLKRLKNKISVYKSMNEATTQP